MAKITDIKNPLTSSGNILNIGDWLGAIWWVVFFGTTFAIGAKVVQALDAKLPGSTTPDMAGFKAAPTVAPITVL